MTGKVLPPEHAGRRERQTDEESVHRSDEAAPGTVKVLQEHSWNQTWLRGFAETGDHVGVSQVWKGPQEGSR